jgi:tRNA A-37 threonylcarbamoyl transferase component Bud32
MSTGKLTQNQVLDEHVEELQNLENQDYADEVYQEIMEEVHDEFRINEYLEGTESLNEDSLTNDLRYDPEEDLIIKKYNDTWESVRDLSFTQFFSFAANILKGEVKFPRLEDRMDKEVDIKEEIEELEKVDAPEVEDRVRDIIAYEKLEAENLKNYLPENPEKAYEVGKIAGEGLREMKENNIQQTDSRPVNLMVEESNGELELYLVDQEYSRTDKEDERGLIDIDTFMFNSGTSHLDPEIYEEVREGFEEGYGEEFRIRNDIANSIVSPAHALILEKDPEGAKNSVMNSIKKLS